MPGHARPTRILHVTECYEAGVGLAIDSTVEATQESEHHLLYEGSRTPTGFASVARLAPSLAGRIRQVGLVASAAGADVVHAHSSWAGVYTRLAPSSVPIVYQPHCYKFADPRCGALSRRAYRSAERLLARRGAVTVAVGAQELLLAENLRARDVTLVPNRSALPWRTRDLVAAARPTVVTVGRASRQKNPDLFGEIAEQVLQAMPHASVRWIGDGDPDAVARLRRRGVDVTGWLDQEALMRELDRATVYVHTADYEGFPIAILDAAARDLPVIAREAPYLIGTPVETYSDALGGAQLTLGLLSSGVRWEGARAASRALRSSMNRDVQRDALNLVYTRALKGGTHG